MSDLLIRDVPEPLRLEIVHAAQTKRQSLSATALELLREGLLARRRQVDEPGRSGWEALRSVFEDTGGADGEFARVMDEVEAERKRDFGRPVDFGADDR